MSFPYLSLEASFSSVRHGWQWPSSLLGVKCSKTQEFGLFDNFCIGLRHVLLGGDWLRFQLDLLCAWSLFLQLPWIVFIERMESILVQRRSDFRLCCITLSDFTYCFTIVHAVLSLSSLTPISSPFSLLARVRICFWVNQTVLDLLWAYASVAMFAILAF